MICFIDGPFIKENKYDIVYLGAPNVNLDSPAFSEFDLSSLKEFDLTEQEMVSEDFVFVVSSSGGVASLQGNTIYLEAFDLLVIHPRTQFTVSGSNLSARSMRGDPKMESAEFVGLNCKFSCRSTSITFDNSINKKNAINKLYDLRDVALILPTLTFQMYNQSKNLVFPDRKKARFVFYALQKLNEEYQKHYADTLDKSKSHLISIPSPPMSEREDLEEIMKWIKMGFQTDYHSRSLGNVKLF